jgi:chemotaxis methyl-accepting protein methylase
MYDEAFLGRAILRRRQAIKLPDALSYNEFLLASPSEALALRESLRIHHSEFFRNPLTFDLLEHRILNGLVERKESSGAPEIRVWSAGCAAGQEPYSVSILLQELSEARQRPVPFRIFATDRAEDQLVLARRGEYDAAAVGNVRWRQVNRWFTGRGSAFVIAEGIRDQVDFSVYDLLDERGCCPPASIFGEFDLILCCNLLFYYRSEGRRIILNKLRSCLAPGGYVVTGEAEREILLDAGFLPADATAPIFQGRG